MTVNQNTPQQRRSLLPKQIYPHHQKQRCQLCHWTTSSQASVPETEASIESNPIHDSPTAVANSSCSDSPAMDLPELQADADLAINHMLSVRRSSELKRQWVIWDYEASLHQWEAKAAAANERAKIACLRKGLQARVKCAKVVMRAKYDYRVAVQEARAARWQ